MSRNHKFRGFFQVTLHCVDRVHILRVRDRRYYPLWHQRAAKPVEMVSVMADIVLNDKRRWGNWTRSTRYSWQYVLINHLIRQRTSARPKILKTVHEFWSIVKTLSRVLTKIFPSPNYPTETRRVPLRGQSESSRQNPTKTRTVHGSALRKEVLPAPDSSIGKYT